MPITMPIAHCVGVGLADISATRCPTQINAATKNRSKAQIRLRLPGALTEPDPTLTQGSPAHHERGTQLRQAHSQSLFFTSSSSCRTSSMTPKTSSSTWWAARKRQPTWTVHSASTFQLGPGTALWSPDCATTTR